MVVIKDIDDFVFNGGLCWIENDGDREYVVCAKSPHRVPEELVEYEEEDVEPVIDEFTEHAIRYILDYYLKELIDIAKDMGINVDVSGFKKKKSERRNDRKLDEFFT